ncbi:MAG TPA: hypothetical protein VH796_03270 [Nitrososphaeraceae archaeon]
MNTISRTGFISPEDEKDFCFYQCKLCGTIHLMHGGGLEKHEHMVVDHIEPGRVRQ